MLPANCNDKIVGFGFYHIVFAVDRDTAIKSGNRKLAVNPVVVWYPIRECGVRLRANFHFASRSSIASAISYATSAIALASWDSSLMVVERPTRDIPANQSRIDIPLFPFNG